MIEHLRGREKALEPLGWTAGGVSDPYVLSGAVRARQDPHGTCLGRCEN